MAEADPLVGIDPDQTVDLEVGGATLTVGPMVAALWERFYRLSLLANQDATRRAIAKLKVAGVDPTAVVRKLGPIDVSALDAELTLDPEYASEISRVHLEALRFGLRGHRGIVKRDGTEVPFKTSSERVNGQDFTVVAPETLRFYAVNPRLVLAAWNRLHGLHVFGDVEKKA